MRISPLSSTLAMTLLLAFAIVVLPAFAWADDIVAVFRSSSGSTITGCTVPILAVSFDVENPTSIGNPSSGAGSGKAKLNPIKITKAVDACSPQLFVAAMTGQHYASVQFAFRSKSNSQPYLLLELGTVFITKIAGSASTENAFREVVELAYGALSLSVPSGSEVCWDQTYNTNTCP